MYTKLERLLSKSLTTLEVMTYYLVVHMGPGRELSNYKIPNPNNNSKARTKEKKKRKGDGSGVAVRSSETCMGAGIAQLVVLGLAVHGVAGSILLR